MRFISRQKAEGRRQKGGAALPAACRPLPACSHGFTLVEMLVVMGIIVLAITLAIPTIRFLTGSKSEQAAQNTVSAFLARTRAEAIGLQQPEGVLFYLDPLSDRVVLTQVTDTPLAPTDSSLAGAAYLDLVPDRDNLMLPNGIRLQTITSPVKNPTTDPPNLFPNDRYIGFNAIKDGNGTAGSVSVGGVILFDAAGRLSTRYYVFRCEANQGGQGVQTAMGQLLQLGKTGSPYQPLDNTVCQGVRSTTGFVLFDRQTFTNVGGTDADASPTPAAEAVEEQWLDNNTTPTFIDRYNGTLIRAE